MELELNQNGLTSLDPMYFWRFVMKFEPNARPRVLVMLDYFSEVESLIPLLAENKGYNFIVESKTKIPSIESHILTRHPDQAKGEDPRYEFGRTDYIICDESQPQVWLPPMLTGVQPIFSYKELENLKPLEKVDRVNNFEIAKSKLFHLTHP